MPSGSARGEASTKVEASYGQLLHARGYRNRPVADPAGIAGASLSPGSCCCQRIVSGHTHDGPHHHITSFAIERNPIMTSVSNTTPTAPAPTISRPRVWAWPIAIILGFPIGGYIANLTVGAVDSVGAAVAGGPIAGAGVGAAQGLALRRPVPRVWIAAPGLRKAARRPPAPAPLRYRHR